jgi:hypothetical protein
MSRQNKGRGDGRVEGSQVLAKALMAVFDLEGCGPSQPWKPNKAPQNRATCFAPSDKALTGRHGAEGCVRRNLNLTICHRREIGRAGSPSRPSLPRQLRYSRRAARRSAPTERFAPRGSIPMSLHKSQNRRYFWKLTNQISMECQDGSPSRSRSLSARE